MKLTKKAFTTALLAGKKDSYTRVTIWADYITASCGSKADSDIVKANAAAMGLTIQKEHYVNKAWNIYFNPA